MRKPFLILLTLLPLAVLAALHPVNLGTAPTGTGGDNARSAFTKVNSNTVTLWRGSTTIGSGLNNYRAAINTPTNWSFVFAGDSFSLYPSHLVETANRFTRWGSNGMDMPFGAVFAQHLSGGATQVNRSDLNTNWFQGYVDVGSNSSAGAGRITFTNIIDVTTVADTLRVRYITSPSAGTLYAQVFSNAAWRTIGLINAAGTYGSAVRDFTVPTGPQLFSVLHSNGMVRVLGLGAFHTKSNAPVPSAIGAGGLSLQDIAAVHTNVVYPQFGAFGRGLMTLFCQENSNSVATNIVLVQNIMARAATNLDLVVFAPTQVSPETDTEVQADIWREACRTNGWFYYDTRRFFSNFFQITNQFGPDDGGGTHITAAAQKFLCDGFIAESGIFNGLIYAGYGLREPYARLDAANTFSAVYPNYFPGIVTANGLWQVTNTVSSFGPNSAYQLGRRDATPGDVNEIWVNYHAASGYLAWNRNTFVTPTWEMGIGGGVAVFRPGDYIEANSEVAWLGTPTNNIDKAWIGNHVFRTNTISAANAATVAVGITNGDFGLIVLSNSLQSYWMSNNVLNWKKLVP